ncbi:MAG: hypothetical protein IJ343_07945 [Clostridia bacterium]|nr:hypothetical protein [Clostridia bacterium]
MTNTKKKLNLPMIALAVLLVVAAVLCIWAFGNANGLQGKLSGTQAELAQIQKILAEKTEEALKLRGDVQTAAENQTRTAAALSETENDLASAVSNLADKEAVLLSTEEALAAALTEVEALTQAKADADAQIAALNEQLAQLQTQLDQVLQEQNKAMEALAALGFGRIEPAAEEPAGNEAVVEAPVAEAPVEEAPVVEEILEEEPAEEEPVTQTPASNVYTADALKLVFEAPVDWIVDDSAADVFTLTDPADAATALSIMTRSAQLDDAQLKEELGLQLNAIGQELKGFEPSTYAVRTLLGVDGVCANYRAEKDGAEVFGRVHVTCVDGVLYVLHVSCPLQEQAVYTEHVYELFRETVRFVQ